MSVKAFDRVQRRLQREHEELVKEGHRGGWQTVGTRNGISGAMAHLIAMRGYYPRDPAICHALGLTMYGRGRICSVHGKVCDVIHRVKRTDSPPRVRRDWKKLAAWSAALWLSVQRL